MKVALGFNRKVCNACAKFAKYKFFAISAHFLLNHFITISLAGYCSAGLCVLCG